MGKLNGTLLRYLEKEDFRVLTAIEMGMKNHEIVPIKLIASISGVREGSAFKTLAKLSKHRLTAYEAGKSFDGYRLTTTGYDYLALNSLVKQGAVFGLGSQVGVGKESDVYLVCNEASEEMCLKLHRLGRTSFRQLKNKRDYHRHRKTVSWLYLSRLAAELEFTYMKALYDRKFSVPIPVGYSRHAVLMSVAQGYPLCQVDELSDPAALCSKLMRFITRLASYGLIHCDFNEFNILVDDNDDDDDDDSSNDGEEIDQSVTVIDFPQMVSINHRNAVYYFDRDVAGVRDFFAKKFGYICPDVPDFGSIQRKDDLDVQLKASGYNHNTSSTDAEVPVETTDDATDELAESEETEQEGDDDSSSNEGDDQVTDESSGDEKEQSATTSMNQIRAIVRKQVRRQRTKQANRVIIQSSVSSRGRRKVGNSSDMCTEDFFVQLIGS